jgi:hypothetical protein
MTVEYSATEEGFKKNFIGNISSEYLTKSNLKYYLALAKNLYKLTASLGHKDDFFTAEKNIDFFEIGIRNNGYNCTFFDKFSVNYEFFNKIPKHYRIVIYDSDKKRYTVVKQNFLKNSNDAKTKSSFLPNFIHSVDSALLRIITVFNQKNEGYATVHDAFLVPSQESFIFKDHVNFCIKLDTFFVFNFEKKDCFDETSVKNIKFYNEKIEKSYCFFIVS